MNANFFLQFIAKPKGPIWLIAGGVLLLIALILRILVVMPGLLPRSAGGMRDAFSQFELSQIQSGDLILRRGPGTASDLIAAFLNDGTNLSHCALVLDVTGGIKLLQCVNSSFGGPDGVQEISLTAFNQNSLADSLVVVRPRISGAGLKQIVQVAGRFRNHPSPFDNNFDLNDRQKLYCSELIVSIFEDAGWWARPQQGHSPNYSLTGALLNFRTFLNPRWFRIIINHNPAIPG